MVLEMPKSGVLLTEFHAEAELIAYFLLKTNTLAPSLRLKQAATRRAALRVLAVGKAWSPQHSRQ